MRRKLYLSIAVCAAAVIGVVAVRRAVSEDELPPPPKTEPARAASSPLPIKQVILFNSGVGYFQREGQVAGDSQVDLSFATGDVNDLLKSLVFEDMGGGRVNAVSYDSSDPVDKILRSFALDLNNNPS